MTLTPTDIRNAVLLSVATFAAGFLLPNINLAMFMLPVAAFSLGWMAYRFGSLPSVALALAAAIPVAVFGPGVFGIDRLDALFVAVALLVAGPGTAWALKRHSALSVVASASILMAAAYLVTPTGAQSLAGTIEAMRQITDALVAGGGVADPAAFKVDLAARIAEMTMSWPSLIVYSMGVGMLLAVPLVSRAGRSLGQQVNGYPALADADLSFDLVWPTIVGLTLLAAGTFWGAGRGAVSMVGLNVLMLIRPALALQGLSVFAALYRKIGVGRFMRTGGFALLGLTEVLLPSVSVLGVIDLFLNIRKVPRSAGTPATGTVR